MKSIEKVFIVGGTHGNEPIGAYVVNNLDQLLVSYPLQIVPIVGNPEALAQGVRYVDQDLNRSFLTSDLQNIELDNTEEKRAKLLNNQLGPKGNNNNFIIDIHTTNANLGICLMTSSRSLFKISLLSYISSQVQDVSILYTPSNEDRPYLNSISPESLLIEVGGVSNNILSHEIVEKIVNVLRCALDYLAYRSLKTAEKSCIEAYQVEAKVPYPRSLEGEISGVIHKQLQGKDFKKLINSNTPVFIDAQGGDITLDIEGEYYSCFVNESAYYEEDTAFYLVRKITLE